MQKSMSVRFIAFILFLSIAYDGHTESIKSVVIAGDDKTNVAAGVYPTPDGGVFIAGRTGGGTRLLKLNANGDADWHYRVAGEPPFRFLPIADGHILSGYYSIAKMDRSGSIQWNRRFATTNDNSVLSPVEKAQGGYVVTKLEFHQFHLLKVDQNGRLEWQKLYQSQSCPSRTNSAQFVFTFPDGYLMLGHSMCQSTLETFLLKTDLFGRIAWQKNYIGIGSLEDVKRTSDGGFIVASNIFGGPNDSATITMAIKFDQSGNLQWAKNYSPPFRIEQLVMKKNGFLALNFDGQILRFDARGEPLWSKSYQIGKSSIYHLSKRPRGGFFVAGVTEAPFTKRFDSLVFRITNQGEVAGGSSCLQRHVHDLPVTAVHMVKLKSSRITFRVQDGNVEALDLSTNTISVPVSLFNCE
jgi:hypothetical protein